MMALYVVLTVIGGIVLILFSSLHLKVRWENEVQLSLRFWFFSFDLLSKKKKKHKKKASSRKKTESAKPEEKKKRSLSDGIGFLKFLAGLLREVPGEFIRRLTVRLKRLELFVAAKEPDQTALLYGAVCPLVYQLCEGVGRFTKSNISYDKVGVYSDFCSQAIHGTVDLRLSIRIIDLLFIGARALFFLQQYHSVKGGSHNERDPVETSH